MGDVRPIECERTRHLLSVALDCELSQLGQARVVAHLDDCAACRSFHESIADVTLAVRAAPLEPLRIAVQLPAIPSTGWSSARRLASVGAAAAVTAVAFLGLAAAPDRSSWRDDGALIASALDRPSGTNDLLIDVIRPTLTSRQHQSIAFGEGGIGAYKPPLAPGS